MATRYIDLNASNSFQINEKNNRYRVRLNDTYNLPAGTQVQVHSSLVNLQGITGQSIELEKDFEETILFNFYAVDTSYPTPAVDIGDPNKITSFNLYPEMRGTICSNKFAPFLFEDIPVRAPTVGGSQQAFSFYDTFPFGFTENIMPLAGVMEIENQNGAGIGTPTDKARYLVPLCGFADIKIPKGIYSVESLGELLTEQINGVIGTDDTISFYDRQKQAQTYKGNLVTNTTTRMVSACPKDVFNDWANQNPAGQPFPSEIPDLTELRPLGKDDTAIVGAIAVRPDHMNDIFFQAKNNVYNTAQNPDTTQVDQVFLPTSGSRRYGFTFLKTNGEDVDFDSYNLYTNGFAQGTTGLKISYDSEKSGFSITHLHEPRRIPTNDKRGNAMSNPSQECVYSKRVYDPASTRGGINPVFVDYYDNVSEANQTLSYQTLNAIMQRYCGVQVYNWAYKTSSQSGNVKLLDVANANTRNPFANQFWNFEDHFSTRELAKKAWEETLWFRLGFTYDQLQNPDNYLKEQAFGVDYQLQGTTTGADIDSSIIPFISTNYNNYGDTQPAGAKPVGDQSEVLPNVTTVQLFNMLDVNVPRYFFNNNKNLKTTATGPGDTPQAIPIAVTPYIGSFFNYAVMFDVQTSGADIVAKDLPRLSVNGYMLVLSDIVNENDQAGKMQELGILDIIPKSSLSNQDFIANTNNLVHILSNPKSVNEIIINIVNPDLTDIPLEPNSSILIKIIKPLEKPTILMANAGTEIAEEDVKQEVLNEIQAQQKMAKKQSK